MKSEAISIKVCAAQKSLEKAHSSENFDAVALFDNPLRDVDAQVGEFLDGSSRPAYFKTVDVLRPTETDEQLRRPLSHEAVDREDVPYNLPSLAPNHNARPDSLSVTPGSLQLDAQEIRRRCRAVKEQPQRPAPDGCDQEVGCSIVVEIPDDGRAGIGIEIDTRSKRAVQKRAAVHVEIQPIPLKGAQVMAGGRHLKRIVDPELTGLPVDVSEFGQQTLAIGRP